MPVSADSTHGTFDCSAEGLAYIAGFIAHNFLDSHPELGQKTSEFDFIAHNETSPWISQLSRGGLIKPSEDFLKNVFKFEEIFKEFHEEGISDTKGVTASLIKIMQLKFPDISPPIIQKFVRTRMFIRIKHLNREIKALSAEKRHLRKIKQFTT